MSTASPRQFQRRIDRALAPTGGILEYRHIQITRRQRILRRVNAADDDIGHILGCGLHRPNRTSRHFVVVGDDGVERAPGRQAFGHQVGTLCARPVRGLPFDNRDEAAIGAAWSESLPIITTASASV